MIHEKFKPLSEAQCLRRTVSLTCHRAPAYMKQKEDLSKILCILSRAFIGQKEEGATWAGEVASNAWLPHILALVGVGMLSRAALVSA